MVTWDDIKAEPDFKNLSADEVMATAEKFRKYVHTKLPESERQKFDAMLTDELAKDSRIKQPQYIAKVPEQPKQSLGIDDRGDDIVSIVDETTAGQPVKNLTGDILYYENKGVYRDKTGKIISEGAPPTPEQYGGVTEKPIESNILTDPVVNAVTFGTAAGINAARAGTTIPQIAKQAATEATFGAMSGPTEGVTDLARLGTSLVKGGINAIKGGPLKAKMPIDIPETPIITEAPIGSAERFEQVRKANAAKASELFKAEQGASQSFKDVMQASREAAVDMKDKSLGDIYNTAKTKIYDIQANVKGELRGTGVESAEIAARKLDLIKGSSGRAQMIMDEYSKGIWGNLNKQETDILNGVAKARRDMTVSLSKPDALHGGSTPQDAMAYLDELKRTMNPEQYGKVIKSADNLNLAYKSELDRALKAGLIDEKSYKNMLNKGDYSPRVWINLIDPEVSSLSRSGKKISVSSSGFKPLSGGTEGLLLSDQKLMLSEYVSRLDARIARNEANKALMKFAEDVPGNGIAWKVENMPMPKTKALSTETVNRLGKDWQSEQWANTIKGEPIDVMIDGKKQTIAMRPDLAKEWVNTDPAIAPTLANFISWVSGAKILRNMATVYNPAFALRNIPRDIAYTWMSPQYATFAPKFAGQMAADLATTFKDAWTKTGRYKDYVMQGGSMEWMSNPEKGNVMKAWGKVRDIVQKLNNFTEVWVRLAHRERALKNMAATNNGIITPEMAEQATHIARTSLDFSQGGSWIKALDSGIPYLNAAFQGTRGIMKFAKADPAKFTIKAAQLGMISSGMYYAAHLNFPEVMDQVSEQQQKDNFIIPMGGLYTVDKNGEKRYAYVSIPKDQSQRAITSVFEYLASKSIGKPRDLSYVGRGVLDFLPITPTQLSSPVQNALRTYVENKDTFTGENVWKGKNVLPKDEYTRTTAPQFVQFGQATGMSPERTKAALQKVFTYGNLFTDIAGYGFKKVLSESGTAGDEIMKDIQTKIPLFSGLVKFTNPKSELEPMIKDMEANENSRRLNMGRQIDKFIEKGQGGYAPGFQPWLQEQRPEDMKWAINDYRTKMITKDVPNKNFWISLKNMPDETRANVFYHEYQKADDQKKAELMRNVALFKLRTIPFTMYFNKLLSGGTQ